jgi:hypothetical protein
VVRRVLDAEVKNEVLRLQVQRLGQNRPTKLEICRNRDWRTPPAKRVSRASGINDYCTAYCCGGFPGSLSLNLLARLI